MSLSTRSQFPQSGVRIEQHGGLIYVYLDTPEAVKAAPMLLPATRRGVARDGCEVWVYKSPEDSGSPAA